MKSRLESWESISVDKAMLVLFAYSMQNKDRRTATASSLSGCVKYRSYTDNASETVVRSLTLLTVLLRKMVALKFKMEET